MVQPVPASPSELPPAVLDSLYESGQQDTGPSLTQLLADTLAQVIALLQADAGAIFVADANARELVLASYQGLSAEFAAKEARLPIGTCMCGHTVEAEDSLFLIEDVTRDARCVIGSCVQDGFLSLLCLPLRAGQRVWGLLRLHGRRRSAFDPREARFLAFISSQLGLAIQRLRLQEQIARLFQQIAEERATLASLVRSLIDALIVVDDKGCIAYWNPSAERYLGLEAAAVVGQPLAAVDRHLAGVVQDPAQVLEQLRQAIRDIAGFPQVEFQLLAPAPRTLQARFFPVQAHRGYGIVLRDVTAERHLDDIKSQLLSTVSHELRTPLASIKGFATTLLRNDVQWDAATRREFLQIIDQESDRLGELIANLLEMSRIEAGVLRIDCDWLDLPALIAEAVDEMRLRTTSHTFVVDVPPDLPRVYADTRRIRQVLHNLLENAIKYSPTGEIRASAREQRREITISVSDQGIGIAPGNLERIFERFFQVDAAATRRAGGTGLGLSICKGIVEAHGGRIWAESTPGQGSTFHFTLPIDPTLSVARSSGRSDL